MDDYISREAERMDSRTTQSINFNATYCLHRLPCGYCTMLNRPCPMMGMQYEPTWKPEITCQTGGGEDGDE